MMAIAIEIVKEFFPDELEDVQCHILWEETGYPEFWNIPGDGATPEACLRKQLAELRDRLA